MRKRLPAALLFWLVVSVQPSHAERVERRVEAMGTLLAITVDAGSRAAGLAASESAMRAIEGVEKRLSTWRSDSELSMLNAAPAGAAVTLSTELFRDLSIAKQCWVATSGYFDPTVGALVQAWELRGRGRIPSNAELRFAREHTDFSSIALAQNQGGVPVAVKSKPGVILEEGGFGKGAGLDAALTALAAVATVTGAVLDFGGQVALLRQTRPEAIAIADPDDRLHAVLTVLIDHGSLSVSGNSEKSKVVDGTRIGHLLDPKTGRPAADFGAVAVWTANGLWADCLSSALFAMGPAAALQWAKQHPETHVLVLTRGRTGRIDVTASEGLRGRVQILAPRVHVRYLQGDALQ